MCGCSVTLLGWRRVPHAPAHTDRGSLASSLLWSFHVEATGSQARGRQLCTNSTWPRFHPTHKNLSVYFDAPYIQKKPLSMYFDAPYTQKNPFHVFWCTLHTKKPFHVFWCTLHTKTFPCILVSLSAGWSIRLGLLTQNLWVQLSTLPQTSAVGKIYFLLWRG